MFYVIFCGNKLWKHFSVFVMYAYVRAFMFFFQSNYFELLVRLLFWKQRPETIVWLCTLSGVNIDSGWTLSILLVARDLLDIISLQTSGLNGRNRDKEPSRSGPVQARRRNERQRHPDGQQSTRWARGTLRWCNIKGLARFWYVMSQKTADLWESSESDCLPVQHNIAATFKMTISQHLIVFWMCLCCLFTDNVSDKCQKSTSEETDIITIYLNLVVHKVSWSL